MALPLDDEIDLEGQLSVTRQSTHEAKVELLGRLLDSDNTLFSKQVRDWLAHEDGLKILIHYVTRPGVSSTDTPFTILHSEEYIHSSNRRRDALIASEEERRQEGDGEVDEEEFSFSIAAKRADKAAEVFAYQVGALIPTFINNNLEDIVKEVFAIFHHQAEGDFENFDKMFAALLVPYGTQVFGILNTNRTLILNLLHYLHDPAISETLIGVLKASLPEEVMIPFYTALNEEGFWEVLGQKIYGPGAEASFEYASAFFVRLVEQCATQIHADILFSHLINDTRFIDGLLDCISQSSDDASKIVAINALRTILFKSGEQLYDNSLESYSPTPVTNMLSCIQAELHNHMRTRVDVLVQKLTEESNRTGKQSPEVKFSNFRVSPFTVARLHLTEVFVELAQRNPQEVLDSCTVPLWKVLSEWLFEHRFNNIYHDLFYRLFRAVVKINHTESLKTLLSKQKFLTRMIEHYRSTTSTDSGLRGYIILMANYMRLTADTQPPSEYLRSFLVSHTNWKEFLPLLRCTSSDPPSPK
jgi:hypothetical protein